MEAMVPCIATDVSWTPFFTPVRLLLWGGILVLALVGLHFIVLWVRRRYYEGGGRTTSAGAGFSIEALEELRGAGQISEEEFRSLRRGALGLDGGSEKSDGCGSSIPISDDEGKGDAPDG